jgi:cytochrome bd-type quinol oxidase subunit 2
MSTGPVGTVPAPAAASPSPAAAGIPVAPAAPSSVVAPAKYGGYKDPTDALEKVGAAFNDWSGSLTTASLQMCYAVIGANWIIFQKVGAIRGSWFAKLSMTAVLVALLVNVTASYLMSWLHKGRYKYAEDNADRWRDLFIKCAGTSDPFPYTKWIERVGSVTRLLKFLLPLVGGVLLIVGAWKGK